MTTTNSSFLLAAATIILFVVFIFLIISNNVAAAVSVLFVFVFVLGLFYRDQIKAFNVLKGELEFRELKANLKDLRQVIETNARAILELAQTQMRMGGIPYEERMAIYHSLEEVLKSAEFNDKEIESIQSRWHYWVEGDYVRDILKINNIHPPFIAKDRRDLWLVKRDELKGAINSLTPDDLRGIMQEFGSYDDAMKSKIDDFEFYKTHKKHRDVARWKARGA